MASNVPPLLLLPFSEKNSVEGSNLDLHLYSLKHMKPSKLNFLENFRNYDCVGSSHGWLGFLDQNSNPFLLNPFSRTRIDLPPQSTLSPSHPNPLLSSTHIDKVVLSQDPYSHADTFVAIAMYGLGSHTKMAFCRLGDEDWSNFHDAVGKTYYDVVCCEKTNTAFALGPGPRVESWDLNQTLPKKKMIIQDSCPRTLKLDSETFPEHLYSSRWYLGLSPLGRMYLVVRYVGEFVRFDGEVVEEIDVHDEVCPYSTLGFNVFRFDPDQKEWIDVVSLDDFAMFLGGNESMMVSTVEHSELKKNAIYFTDDYWEQMGQDFFYGGHDMGIFNLDHGSFDPILECGEEVEVGQIKPAPIWISLPSHGLKKRKAQELSWI